MPTFNSGDDVQQNPIRLGNLVREARNKLAATGMRAPEARKLLQPVEKLEEDSFFRRHLSDGLAVFVSDGFLRYYHLPVAFKEAVTVTNRFLVKPLLPLLSNDGMYYVLAISQKNLRLLQCTRYGATELDLADVIPGSLAEFRRYDDMDRELQFHGHSGTGGRGTRGEIQLMSHGRGPGDAEKNDLLRLFQKVDKELAVFAGNFASAPLVLAGVEYLRSIYRQANTYKSLLEPGIEGNPDGLGINDLRKKAWVVVEPYFDQARQKALKRYTLLAGTGHTSDDLSTVIAEAYRGKVDLLLTSLDSAQWGTFDPVTSEVKTHASPEPCDDDLLDSTVAYSLNHGGEVYVLDDKKDMPNGALAAALLRF
jgi:hypothetical protein